MTRKFDVLIVGAGHAGAQAAIALRQRGFAGSIAIAGDEPEAPYERPPLSKEYLAGDRAFEKMLLRPIDFWASADITLLTGQSVTAVDPVRHTVKMSGGEVVAYGKLVWAAGGAARRLSCSGHDLQGVHSLRSRLDVDRLMSELPSVGHVVVVGGGFIGLEAAAGLIKAGKTVSLLEAQARVLARVCGAEIAAFYEAEHRSHGVDVRTSASVAAVETNDGVRVSGVRLTSGEAIACDMVIVGIGIEPSVEPLRQAGASCEAGVIVDGAGRTSLPDIYAAGDCVLKPNAFAGGRAVRVESVQNASVTAVAVAADITGSAAVAEAVPWFWSNQFDLRMQTAGINIGFDRTVIRGDPSTRSFAVAYLDGDRLLACDCVNAAKPFAQVKRMLTPVTRIDADIFSDVSRQPDEAVIQMNGGKAAS